ncbi:MAG: PilZ domain-containing protein [Desulfuromonadales bacterium]
MMLTDALCPSSATKTVFLDLPQASLQDVLRSLLQQWHFDLTESSTKARMQLTAPSSRQLTLHGPAGLSTHLSFPLRIEELWRAVEAPFYPFPRAHIRLNLELALLLNLRGQREETSLSSLSDRGLRFLCGRELVPEEEVEAEMELEGEVLRLQGTVIYAQSRANGWETGAVFQHITPAERLRVRNFIVRTLLARVRSEVGEDSFHEAVGYFHLPASG